jgi:hypothetical protein
MKIKYEKDGSRCLTNCPFEGMEIKVHSKACKEDCAFYGGKIKGENAIICIYKEDNMKIKDMIQITEEQAIYMFCLGCNNKACSFGFGFDFDSFDFDMCTKPDEVKAKIKKLRKAGLIKKSELEEARENYYKIFSDENVAGTITHVYIKALEKEIERLKR